MIMFWAGSNTSSLLGNIMVWINVAVCLQLFLNKTPSDVTVLVRNCTFLSFQNSSACPTACQEQWNKQQSCIWVRNGSSVNPAVVDGWSTSCQHRSDVGSPIKETVEIRIRSEQTPGMQLVLEGWWRDSRWGRLVAATLESGSWWGQRVSRVRSCRKTSVACRVHVPRQAASGGETRVSPWSWESIRQASVQSKCNRTMSRQELLFLYLDSTLSVQPCQSPLCLLLLSCWYFGEWRNQASRLCQKMKSLFFISLVSTDGSVVSPTWRYSQRWSEEHEEEVEECDMIRAAWWWSDVVVVIQDDEADEEEKDPRARMKQLLLHQHLQCKRADTCRDRAFV